MGLHPSSNRRWDGDCVIMGDFNEVRMEQERYGSVFNVQVANAFNSFISLASLIDLPLDGYAYTWAHKTANKMSKFFHSWFNLDGFDKMVEDTWKSLATVDSNGGSNEEILSDRSLLLKELNDINSIDSLEAARKSKVRWAIEGDENTKFFHGILNSNFGGKEAFLLFPCSHVEHNLRCHTHDFVDVALDIKHTGEEAANSEMEMV
ncbi:RNA-directed DNA polymerase, eukaryota [Tanacetum coccineum]|uniref:RNA-directed DNA polymerase, eukaryota n=1 Tax=Tanacetum coccineum TaxID=301880 RepID=A0ABQ5IQT2_9ASTR